MSSGLDINLGNLCSKDAYNWAKTTFANRSNKAGEIALKVDGAFSNMLIFGKERIGIASDGIGTKIELAERTKIYNSLGYDLVAMVVDDLATAGFEPTNISNIIDVDSLDQNTINSMMSGLADASNFAKINISGGEIAELGSRINGYGEGMHFNWCSTAIGALPAILDGPIDGSKVAPGQSVIALRSRGFRSNGFSLIRKVMQENFGDEWHNAPYDTEKTWGEMLLTPSLIYSPLIQTWIQEDKLELTGAAHITGGGIFENFDRCLKTNGFGAELYNLFEPLEMMTRLQELGGISNEEAYLYWNMGNGMLVVLPENQVDRALETAKRMGYAAQKAGHIIQERSINASFSFGKILTTF